MSKLRANQIVNKASTGAPTAPNGLVVTGVTTSTSYVGSGANLTSLNAGNISSGTLPTTRGGTGLTSIGAAGKALKVNSSANGLEYGDAGAWTKIASGSGPASSATTISLDNIFSDSYKFYKIFYSYANHDWFKGRYIKADGSIESGSVYLWTGQYSRENAADDGRFGNTNTNYAVYHYWDAATDCPCYGEISLYHPYASSKETSDFCNFQAVSVSRVVWQSGMNCNMNAYSVRGIQFFTANGDAINSTNFKYLVLGANI